MTPDTLAKSKSEHGEQRALFAWANMAARFGFDAAWDERCYVEKGYAETNFSKIVPVLAHMFAIPNGGYRDKITAGKLKAEGVKSGVPDVFLPVPCYNTYEGKTKHYHGLFIELKRVKTATQRQGTTSDAQDEWTGFLRSQGYAVAVAFGWRDAAMQIQSYLQWGN